MLPKKKKQQTMQVLIGAEISVKLMLHYEIMDVARPFYIFKYLCIVNVVLEIETELILEARSSIVQIINIIH